MAKEKHLWILGEGVEVWNEWRKNNTETKIDFRETLFAHGEFREVNFSRADLREADFERADLTGADLRGANLVSANLENANLVNANLTEANLGDAYLIGADLRGANLKGAELHDAFLQSTNFINANFIDAELVGARLYASDLRGADLRGADLTGADLTGASLTGANLTGANLSRAILVETKLEEAVLTDCMIYDLAAWGLKGIPKDQSNLVITKYGDPVITVDDIRVAQFIHLLLDNQNIRNVIDTITSKAVLILGRFTEERKTVLEALKAELRKQKYLPIVHDVAGPESRDITETVSTLAHMAKFVIADITDAKSIPQELMAIVPNLPSVPVQPLLLSSQREYSMFEHLKRYPWVMPTCYYTDAASLIASISERVLQPAEAWLVANKKPS